MMHDIIVDMEGEYDWKVLLVKCQVSHTGVDHGGDSFQENQGFLIIFIFQLGHGGNRCDEFQ